MASILSAIKNIFVSGEHSDKDKTNITNITRIAINQSGSVGSFYDAYQDQILGKIGISCKTDLSTSQKPLICVVHKGRTRDTENLLEIVGISYALRLSILLKIVQPTGIASLIDYPRVIDKHTRFLYIHQESRIESCQNHLIKVIKSYKSFTLQTSATHIIAQIIWGIHAIVILQLPPDQETEIDNLLQQICHCLNHNEYHMEFTPEIKHLINKIISTTCYSNIHDLTKFTKLDDIYRRISQMRKNFNEHRQLEYILISIPSSSPQHNSNTTVNIDIDRIHIDYLEQYLQQRTSEMKILKLKLDHNLPELLQGNLQEQLNSARDDYLKLKHYHDYDIQCIRESLIKVRQGQPQEILFNTHMNLESPKEIKDRTYKLITNINALEIKGKLIGQLQNDRIEYCNVVQLGIQQGHNEQLINDILFRNDSNKAIFCSTDILKQHSHEQWTTMYCQMNTLRENNSKMSLVYADFTYSTWYLDKIVILTSKEQTIGRCESNSKMISDTIKRKAPPPPSSSNNEYINILLLGESGVGKSTFINAFANYLRFDTLEQAQSGKPVVVIPVSFLITVNNQFDEELVKFGDADSNEDHNNSGQSVTQQCRSYVFEILHGKRMRIIDTPGFGDTRSDNQDELNMKIIFSFINNLTHLNGICLLLKPNVHQLNPFLYSCFTQLFQFFGENIRDHFSFCFTNARSTFFTPGDTRPLLKSLFDSFSIKRIPLEKKNTFCFDSESFRYLVALQKHLVFNEDDKKEFENSWLRSVEESKRFRHFITHELEPYRKNIEWQSIQEAQLQINLMIRPMLEAMRNILRNILLHKTNSSIKLSATHADHPAIICYTCNRNSNKFGPFWILSDYLHHLPNTVSIQSIMKSFRFSSKLSRRKFNVEM
ncbi:unnamed protein product [Rotaria sp. Silwood1]|nr:unnamed protein product [Rotaria sp. Silwood1]CAF1211252.1 unnamed protein product [Rotaria sp. Silwood1]CAF3464408.1 unnamed protein product [Rotaria sp. Silwood1]CAF4598916.1 unnamed protein product [Rotaria sp. Silwood1]